MNKTTKLKEAIKTGLAVAYASWYVGLALIIVAQAQGTHIIQLLVECFGLNDCLHPLCEEG